MKLKILIFISLFFFFLSNFTFSSCYREFEVSLEKEFFNEDLSGLKVETNEFPRNYENQIVDPVIDDEFVEYFIDDNKHSNTFYVKRYNTISSLRGSISDFPFNSNTRKNIEEKYGDYLDYSDSITQIVDKIELTENSLKNVFKMSDFVHNLIEYDRDITYVQSIDEIISRKTGVCFHYSVLLVDLLRYYGYPAREMNGFAYSNIYDNFEGHSWVEVYVPDIGWIEVDPTFGENYYASSNRIFVSYEDIRTKFEWSGDSSLDYNIYREFNEINSSEDDCYDGISFSLDVSPNEVNFGSQVLVDIEIKNNNPYHLFYPLRLSTPTELNFSLTEDFFLESNSVTKESIVLEIPESFDKDYIYTLPIILSDRFANREESNVKVSKKFSDYQVSLDKDTDRNLILSLDCNDNEFYLFEGKNVSCFLSHNSLDSESFQIKVMSDDEIIKRDEIDVNVNSDEEISFEFFNESFSIHDFDVLVESNSFEKKFDSSYEILEGDINYNCSYDIKETNFICDVNSSFPYSFSVFQNGELIFLKNYNHSEIIEINSKLEIVGSENISRNVFNVDLSARTSKGNYVMTKDYNYNYQYSYFEFIIYKIDMFLDSLLNYFSSFN
ncbi:MAG: transglutaminase-like domain-containing protein [Candidatus Woesearchaeota archaeon]